MLQWLSRSLCLCLSVTFCLSVCLSFYLSLSLSNQLTSIARVYWSPAVFGKRRFLRPVLRGCWNSYRIFAICQSKWWDTRQRTAGSLHGICHIASRCANTCHHSLQRNFKHLRTFKLSHEDASCTSRNVGKGHSIHCALAHGKCAGTLQEQKSKCNMAKHSAFIQSLETARSKDSRANVFQVQRKGKHSLLALLFRWGVNDWATFCRCPMAVLTLTQVQWSIWWLTPSTRNVKRLAIAFPVCILKD